MELGKLSFKSLKSPIKSRIVSHIVVWFIVTCIRPLPVKQELQLLQILKAKKLLCEGRDFSVIASALHIALIVCIKLIWPIPHLITTQQFPILMLYFPFYLDFPNSHVNSEFSSMWYSLTLWNCLNIFVVALGLVLANGDHTHTCLNLTTQERSNHSLELRNDRLFYQTHRSQINSYTYNAGSNQKQQKNQEM